jgi:hypothetical protein
MPTLTQTRIYTQLKDLLNVVVLVSSDLPKSHRYVIGAKMQELAIDMNLTYAKAYLTRGAGCIALMDALLADYSTLRILVTLAVENGWLKGRKRAARLIELMDGIGKQASALRGSFARTYAKECKQSIIGHD